MEGRPCAPLVAAAAQGAGEGAAAGVVACGAGGGACHLRGASAGEGAAACAVGGAGMGGRGIEGSRGAGLGSDLGLSTVMVVLSASRGHGVCISSRCRKEAWRCLCPV